MHKNAVKSAASDQIDARSAVSHLNHIRNVLCELDRMKRHILCEYLPRIYEQAERIEQSEAELRSVLEDRDLVSSRVSTVISDRSDYLRLAIRLAVGLTGNRARSQADKYLTAMRPFFLRGES